MSVQPTSDRRTALQLSGSAAKAADPRTAVRQRPATSDFICSIWLLPIGLLAPSFVDLQAKHHFAGVSSGMARQRAPAALLCATVGVQFSRGEQSDGFAGRAAVRRGLS